MTNTCACGKPTNDYACRDCTREVEEALAECPWLDNELMTTITKQRGAATEGGPRGTNTSLPWHEAASDARRHLLGVLGATVHLCSRTHVTGTPRWHGAATIPARSRWLLNCTQGLALSEDGAAALQDIADAYRACVRVIDLRPEREWAGPCGCGVDLYRTKGQQWVRCDACGEQTDTEELLAQLRGAVMGRLVTAREGAGLLSKFGLSTEQGTIDKWRERKLATEHGHNHKGHRLYLFDDLMEVATRNTRQAG